MIDLLATIIPPLAGCATLLVLWWRVEPLARQWVTWRTEPVRSPVMESLALPLDLVRATLVYGDEWARDQARSAMRESYVKLGSWDAVRQEFGVAPSSVQEL